MTITTHRQPLAHRAMAMIVAVAVLVQSTACSYVPTRPDELTCAQEKTEVLASAKDQAGDQKAIFFNATVDGRWACAAAVPKDDYTVRVFVTWSDGTPEEYGDFSIRIEPGRHYSVLAYEASVGHVPATATLTPKKTPETAATPTQPTTVGQAAAGGIALALLSPILIPLSIVLLPITLPLFIISKSKEAKPKQVRLGTSCCYLWIEDAETRETIAGVAPQRDELSTASAYERSK